MALIMSIGSAQIIVEKPQKATINVLEINGYTVQYGSTYYGTTQKISDNIYNGYIRNQSGNVTAMYSISIVKVPTSNLNMSDFLQEFMLRQNDVDASSIRVKSYTIDGEIGAIGSCTPIGRKVIAYFALYSPSNGALCVIDSNNSNVAYDLISTIHITSSLFPQNSNQLSPAQKPLNSEKNQNLYNLN